jgi:hypothetical protein
MEFCHITTRRHGVTMSTRRGVVRKLRTVRQALVVDERGRAQWVDITITDEQTRGASHSSATAATTAAPAQ